MSDTGYLTITRQAGLLHQMQIVANNIANLNTTGFRREEVIFSEYVHSLGRQGDSVSMAAARVRHTDERQGPLVETGGIYDFAIDGEGYFLVQTPEGDALTRAGSFTPNAAGELVTPDGHFLLDAGGAPVFVPPDARTVRLAADGTLTADGRPVAQVGLFLPESASLLPRQAGTLFLATEEPLPVDEPTLLQGFVEGSNVNAVEEIARMIEVQRAYELGAKFLDQEGERKKSVIQTLGR